jgi:hypothetical protein
MSVDNGDRDRFRQPHLRKCEICRKFFMTAKWCDDSAFSCPACRKPDVARESPSQHSIEAARAARRARIRLPLAPAGGWRAK